MRALLAALRLAPGRRAASAPGTEQHIDSPRLLVVDDLPANLAMIDKMLQSLGLSARLVTSGSEALQAMEAARFDAVITDCRMPGINGFEVARAIRAKEQAGAPRTVVIGISANDSEQDVTECLASGMDEFLAKPLSAQAIGAALERWLPGRKESRP